MKIFGWRNKITPSSNGTIFATVSPSVEKTKFVGIRRKKLVMGNRFYLGTQEVKFSVVKF